MKKILDTPLNRVTYLDGGISEGLDLENIPRTDISVGTQFPTVQPLPHNNQVNIITDLDRNIEI